jgi:hypothetical protein
MRLSTWLGAAAFLTGSLAFAAPPKLAPTRQLKRSNLPQAAAALAGLGDRSSIRAHVTTGTGAIADCHQTMDDLIDGFAAKYAASADIQDFFYAYELYCYQPEGQKGSYYYAFVLEPKTTGAEAELAAYLAERQDRDLGIGLGAVHFDRALGIFKRLVVVPGASDAAGDNFSPIEQDVSQQFFANMGQDHAFMLAMFDAFWATDVETFLGWVGKVLGADYAAYYRSNILPKANEVRSEYEMTFLIAPGRTLPIDFAVTPERDCQTAADQHCI